MIQGHIIDPSQKLDGRGYLVIKNGKISICRAGIPADSDKYTVLDTGNDIICPGFIDLHCHLRDPGFTEKETIASGTGAAAKGGFTTVCCMPNTLPPIDNCGTLDYVNKKAESEGLVRVIPIAAITRGRAGGELVDMETLAGKGIAGFSDDGDPVRNEIVMLHALQKSAELGLPVIDHCENSASQGGIVNEGFVATRLGCKGMPDDSEIDLVARDIALAEATGGWIHIAHVSTGFSADLISGAKERGVKVTAEVTPHHLTLTEDIILKKRAMAKVSPPLRTKADKEMLIRALGEGTIDIVATDHAPHTEADKDCDFARAAFGISGFETAFGSLMQLVHEGEITLFQLIAALTCNPAGILGNRFGKIGTLRRGASADLVIFNSDIEWIVDTGKFVSKGKNTPLAGEKLKGKVMATVYKGDFKYITPERKTIFGMVKE